MMLRILDFPDPLFPISRTFFFLGFLTSLLAGPCGVAAGSAIIDDPAGVAIFTVLGGAPQSELVSGVASFGLGGETVRSGRRFGD